MYNISFDIGTNSVGWAVTDMENEILKFKNKNMWGVRLFEKGDTAKARRISRNTRRRYLRRRNRIELLRNLIGSEVEKVDKTFFLRMNEMALWAEDKSFLNEKQKSFGNQSTLFMDENFTDSDYYKDFRTIYHLRDFLMETDEKVDIRLIYLALHHIIKYRGNFIREGQSLTASKNLKSDIEDILEFLSEKVSINFNNLCIDELEKIIINNEKNKKDKSEEIYKFIVGESLEIDKDEKSTILEVSKAIVGLKANYSKMFFEENIKDQDDKDFSASFTDNNYEEIESKLSSMLGEKFYLIEALKKLNGGVNLNEILKGEEYISKAMCELYKKHNEDLLLLKKVIKENVPNSYKDMFRNKNKKATYAYYIDNGKCDINDLYKYIEEILKEIEDKDNLDVKYILEEIKNERFLKKINSRNNGAIPYQLHL